MKDKIKILIVDDHLPFRQSIVNLLEQYHNIIEVAGIANTGEEYLQIIKSLIPNIALMSIKMQDKEMFYTVQTSIRCFPEIKIIALTFNNSENCIEYLFKIGVRGILCKDASIKELLKAIITVYNGKYYFSEYINGLLNKIKLI